MKRLHDKFDPAAERVTLSGRLGYSPRRLTLLSCKRDPSKMRDYMDRRVTPPNRVTSHTWGPPPPCKQVLTFLPFQRRSTEILSFFSIADSLQVGLSLIF